MLMGAAGHGRRGVCLLVAAALALPGSLGVGLVLAPPAFAAEPTITLAKQGPSQILVGDTGTYTLTATNPTGPDQVTQFNTSFRDVLAPGLVYEGPTTPASAGSPTVITGACEPPVVDVQCQTLIWRNVADLQLGSEVAVSFVVRAETDPLPVSSSFINSASAYTNADPRYVPKFTASGVVVTGTTSYTASATASTGSTGVTAFTIDKASSPTPEAELLRGVHDHVATYSLTVKNNPSFATDDVEIRDYLPAGLEFLGCGTVDNSTDTTLYPDGREYPSAPSLSATPEVADCLVPTAVETVQGPLTDQGRQIPAGVFTKVTWRLGDLAASGPGRTRTITYRAGIPQRANTVDWQGAGAPDVLGGGTVATQPPQTANLDNNTGVSTRETATEQTLTNVVVGDGRYTGPVPGQPGPTVPVSSSTQHTVYVEDLAMQKKVAPTTFAAGGIATYTLTLATSEYVTAEGITLTDTLPNGVCPLSNDPGVNYLTGPTAPDADCDGVAGAGPRINGVPVEYSSVTQNADGTFDVVFPTWPTPPTTMAADATIEVQYGARMRSVYSGTGPQAPPGLTGKPTSAGDAFRNTVALEGTTDIRTDIDVAAPSPDGPEAVRDTSSATQTSAQPVIDKRIKPNVPGALGYQCAEGTSTSNPAGAAPGSPVSTTGAAEYVNPPAPPFTGADVDRFTFRNGSIACFLLRVEFPSQSQTKDPVVTDFLPAGTSYLPGSAVVTQNSTLTGAAVGFTPPSDPAGPVVWEVGDIEGGSRFAPRGAVFEVVFAAALDTAAAGSTPDIVGNLMKFRSVNSAGQAISLRDQLDLAIAPLPPVALVKGISQITPAVPPGSPALPVNVPPAAPTNIDGRTVRDGDVVQFRIDVTNTSDTLGEAYESSVHGVDVWDLLPAGVPCSSVSNASSPAFFSCLDPSAGTYPASLAGTNRSLLRWQFDASDAEAIAAGARRTLTYDFTVPDGVSVATRLTDNAGVRSYEAFTNLPSAPATYYPADNIDPGVPVADRDAPRADDPSNVLVANVTLTKTGTTSITYPAGNTSGLTGNNTANRATIGELVTYTVTATVPYGTSVYQGVLTDTLQAGLVHVSSTAEYSTDNGATWGPTLPTGTVLAANGQLVTLTLPTSYTAAADAAANHVFRVSITARVDTAGANVEGLRLRNTAAFRSKASADAGAPNVTAPTSRTYDVFVVEPDPSLTKTRVPAPPAAVAPGESLTFTLTASNAAGRAPLGDGFVVDCVPAGLVVTGYGTTSPEAYPTEAAAPGDGTNGCAAGTTRLAWNVGQLAGGASAVLPYTVTVAPTAVGGDTYTNSATLTGGTLQTGSPTPDPTERTYTRTAAVDSVVVGGTVIKVIKPGGTTTPTIGEWVTYRVTATVPADVTLYQASVIDTLPRGLDPASVVLEGGTIACTPSCTVGSTPLTPATSGSSTRIGWSLGTLAPSAEVRTLTVEYSAKVADLSGPFPVAGTSLTNAAVISWNLTDKAVPTSAGDAFDRTSTAGSATVTVTEPAVTIAKAVSPNATPAPGEVFTYTVTATNSSATNVSTAFGVAVSDAVPTGVVVDPASITGGGVLTPSGVPAEGGGTITWPSIASLAPGASTSFTYQARLAPSASLTTAGKTNTATVTGYTSIPGGVADGGRAYTGPSRTRTVTPVFPRVTVAKTAPDGAPAYVGDPFTWRYTITNSGASRAYGVDAVDTLPLNWTYTSTSSVVVAGTAVDPVPAPVVGTAPGGAQTLTWTDLGDLDPTQTIVVTYTATPQPAAAVTPGAGATVAHTNTVATTAEDATGAQGNAAGSYAGPPATAVARIHAADLVLDKSHPATPAPVAGATFDWTIRVTNNGPDTAVGPFTVTDTIADPTTFVSATGTGWSCSAVGVDVTCTRADPDDTLAPGASFEDITLRVSVPSDVPAETTLTNTAAVTARTYDPVPGNNTDTDTATSTASADLTIAKGRSGPLQAGREVTYTLDVTNVGPSTSRATITVTDPVPAGTTYVSAGGSGWACSLVTATITCDRAADLSAGQAAPQITVVLAVSSAFTGALANTATVSGPTPDPVPGNNSATVTGEVTTLADVAIEKTHTGGFVPGTGTSSYTFAVRNFGPADAAAPVVVTDVLPERLSYTGSATDLSGEWTCVGTPSSPPVAPDRQTVTCTLTGGLVDGASAAVRIGIAVDVAAPPAGEFVNTSTVSSGTTDPNPSNNTSTDRTEFDSEADLAIAKTPSPQTVRAGENATWTLAVANNGPSNSVGPTVVTDVLPSGTSFVSAGGSGWDDCTVVDRTITCSHPAGVVAGGSLPSITVVAEVAPAVGPSTLVNTASVDGPTADPVPGNNTAEAEVRVVDEADLAITKTFTGTDPVPAGDTTTFALVVQNNGPSDADHVVVADTMPAGLTVVSATGSGWVCATAGQVLSCTRPSLAAGAVAEITLTVRVTSGYPDERIENTATVSTSTPDPVPGNNTSTDGFAVNSSADIVLEKTHTGTAVAGRELTFTLAVRNDGPSDAAAPIRVRDTLPAGMSYVSDGPGWACTTTGTAGVDQVVDCIRSSGGALVAGTAAEPLTITVLIAADAGPGTVTNVAVASSTTPDPQPSNNRDTDPVDVTTLADLVVTKEHHEAAVIGQELGFTLGVSNTGPSEARAVVLTDTLPAGLGYVSAVGTGWTCAHAAGVVTCELAGPLAAGASAPPVTLTVSVGAAAYPQVENVVVGSTSTPESSTSDNTATDPVEVPPLVDLAVTKTHTEAFTVGEQGSYTITVSNAGPTPDPGPQTLVDTLPDGLGFVSGAGQGWACSAAEQVVTCERAAALGVGESSSITLVVAVAPAAAPSVVNTVTVSTPSTETTTDNNMATDPTVVRPVSVLTLGKEVVGVQDGEVTYRIAVTNTGPNATSAPVVVSDPLPTGLEYVSVSGSGWQCGVGGQVVTCTYAASVAVGATTAFVLTARVTAAAGTEVVNVATIVGEGGATAEAGFVVPDSGGHLPRTGADLANLGLLALALLVMGAAAVLTGRDRRRAGDDAA